MRAILFASATIATFLGRRASSSLSQGSSVRSARLCCLNSRAGAVDQQGPQVRIAALADPEEFDPAAGPRLPRHQAEEGGKLAPRAERPRISDRRHHRARRQGARRRGSR